MLDSLGRANGAIRAVLGAPPLALARRAGRFEFGHRLQLPLRHLEARGRLIRRAFAFFALIGQPLEHQVV